MATIRVDQLTHRYATDDGPLTALAGIDLELPDGSFTSIIGPSGCGKSTLLRTLADIVVPSEGSVSIDGRPVADARAARRIGFVFQDPVLLPWRSARHNVELPMQLAGMDKGARRDRADELLELVGLSGFESAAPATLSGGMARRVAIARGLALEPDILLLDEPFAGLDEIRRIRMNLELQRIWSETGTTAVLVTHNVEEAVFLSDCVVVLGTRPGRVIGQLSVDFERPRPIDLTRTAPFFDVTAKLTQLLQDAYEGAE
jgi:NitT/TauT family transport system ATP-binding protein